MYQLLAKLSYATIELACLLKKFVFDAQKTQNS